MKAPTWWFRQWSFERDGSDPGPLVDAAREMMDDKPDGIVRGVIYLTLDFPTFGPPTVRVTADVDALPKLDRIAQHCGARRVL